MSAATYRIFGLDVRFPREVPTLNGARIDAATPPDVEVAFGPVPALEVMETVNDDLDVSWNAEGLTIAVEEVGRFQVCGGTDLLVDPYPGVGRPEVDLYLAGSVMGAVLHQRAILPLHCNAFACADHAILLCGDSGAGKSTLAAWFEARGYALLTDDVCAVTFSPTGDAIGHPGIPRLRLWGDAVEAMDRCTRSASTIPWADGKFELEMTDARARCALPIAAIYHLREAEPATPFAITALDGLAAADALTSSIYRRRLGDLVGRAPGYLRDIAGILAHTPVFRVERTWGMKYFEQESIALEMHSRKISMEKMR